MTAAPKKTVLTAEQKSALRRRCQTDLYFLAKDILGNKDMVPHVHGPMCDTYVQKNPDLGIFEQDDVKTRMILAPRGTFKTSVDIADIVQWILCFPDIRILILTGTQELAWRMVREVKAAFQTNDKIRDLFPELCPERDKKFGSDDEFTSPGRKVYKREPTLSCSTILSIKAGGHYEVIKPDDVVNEINAATPEQCGKVVDAYDDLSYLLEPGGFIDLNGTRYQPWDLYGKLLQRLAAALLEAAEAAAAGDDEVLVPELKYTILAAWTVKPGITLPVNEQNVPIVTKFDVDLLFPERLKFRGLLKQYKANPTKFACQMLNDPLAAVSAARPFTESLINGHVIPFNQLPLPGVGKEYILWDLAGAKPAADGSSDFVVGVVARLDAFGRLYAIDVRRGHWTAIQQAAQIVALQKDYPDAECSYIEDAQGSRYLEPTINQIALQSGVKIWIKWVKIPRFGGAKRFRIDALARLFKADRLWLAAHLPHLDQLKSELIDLNPEFDDISDALALLARELKISSADEQVATPATVAATRKEMRDLQVMRSSVTQEVTLGCDLSFRRQFPSRACEIGNELVWNPGDNVPRRWQHLECRIREEDAFPSALDGTEG